MTEERPSDEHCKSTNSSQALPAWTRARYRAPRNFSTPKPRRRRLSVPSTWCFPSISETNWPGKRINASSRVASRSKTFMARWRSRCARCYSTRPSISLLSEEGRRLVSPFGLWNRLPPFGSVPSSWKNCTLAQVRKITLPWCAWNANSTRLAEFWCQTWMTGLKREKCWRVSLQSMATNR